MRSLTRVLVFSACTQRASAHFTSDTNLTHTTLLWWGRARVSLLNHCPHPVRADHMKFAVQQAFKYQWMFARTAMPQNSRLREPWLLADTDIIVQCSAQEMRRRFARFASPLVIGAEFKWFPKRDYSRNPWPPAQSGLRYPNSGLILGSRNGFQALETAFGSIPRYPCCPAFYRGNATEWCHIDDQHCLQARAVKA